MGSISLPTQNCCQPLNAESYWDLVLPLHAWLRICIVLSGSWYCPIVCPIYERLKVPASCGGDVPGFSDLVTIADPFEVVEALDGPLEAEVVVGTMLGCSKEGQSQFPWILLFVLSPVSFQLG